MSDWNSELYLKFKAERTQPAIDLARRMELEKPEKIADIGCGPGNSTAVLHTNVSGDGNHGVRFFERHAAGRTGELPRCAF